MNGFDNRFTFESAARTDVGRVREQNEDSVFARPDLGVWAVADGVGGHRAGDVASSRVAGVLETIGKSASPTDLLARFEHRIYDANQWIRSHAERQGGDIVATTIVALLIHGGVFACLWAGDSRLYQLRDGQLRQVTRDHTEAQELVERGILSAEEAKRWPRRDVITRALGIDDEPMLDIEQDVVREGDVFLLCSDGLTKHVDDHEIAVALARLTTQQAVDGLVELAIKRGGTDNVTVVVVRCMNATAEVANPAAMGRV